MAIEGEVKKKKDWVMVIKKGKQLGKLAKEVKRQAMIDSMGSRTVADAEWIKKFINKLEVKIRR